VTEEFMCPYCSKAVSTTFDFSEGWTLAYTMDCPECNNIVAIDIEKISDAAYDFNAHRLEED